MKILASLALAATVAFGAMTVSAPKAEAGDAGAAIGGFVLGAIVGSHWNGGYHPQYYRPYRPGPSVQFYYGPKPQPYYYGNYYYAPQPRYIAPQPHFYGGGYNAHVQWCLSAYRTYNPNTNLYFYKAGKQRYCVSPYS